jgi:hypothetical protein
MFNLRDRLTSACATLKYDKSIEMPDSTQWRNIGLCRLCKAQGPSGTGGLSQGPPEESVFLRSDTECTMSAERLSDLAMLPIENERAKKLDISKLVDIFAEEKARKRTF